MLEELPDATRPKLCEPFTENAPRIYTAFDMGNARGLMPFCTSNGHVPSRNFATPLPQVKMIPHIYMIHIQVCQQPQHSCLSYLVLPKPFGFSSARRDTSNINSIDRWPATRGMATPPRAWRWAVSRRSRASSKRMLLQETIPTPETVLAMTMVLVRMSGAQQERLKWSCWRHSPSFPCYSVPKCWWYQTPELWLQTPADEVSPSLPPEQLAWM